MSDSTCPGREKQLKKAHPAYSQYLAHCKRLNQSGRTLATKRCNLWHFHQWLQSQGVATPLDATPSDLGSFVRYLSHDYTPRHEKQISKGSLSRYIGLLLHFYGFLVKERLLLSNPSTQLQHPRESRHLPMDILTPEEFRQLLAILSADTPLKLRDAVMIRILMFSGMRLNELCNIRPDDLDLKAREIVIRHGKGNRDRIAFFDHATQRWLAHYLVHSRPRLALPMTKTLIVTDKGKPIVAARVQDLVAQYLKKANIRKHITPHSFRRTLCSLLLQAGINIKVISEIVGHSSLSTTARYIKVDTETLTRIYQQGHPRA